MKNPYPEEAKAAAAKTDNWQEIDPAMFDRIGRLAEMNGGSVEINCRDASFVHYGWEIKNGKRVPRLIATDDGKMCRANLAALEQFI